MKRWILAAAVAVTLGAGAVPAQTTPAIADSVCVALLRPDSTHADQTLLRQCVLYVALTAPPSLQPPAPLPGTGKKAQAVAAMDSARWYSTFPQLLDSARFDLTDTSSTRPNSSKLQSAIAQLQVALVVALERMKALVTRALVLIDGSTTLPPGDPVPPEDTTGTGTPAPTPLPGDPELPRLIPPVPAGLEAAACTDTVSSNLQAALNGAAPGAVLCLTGKFVGNYTLGARTGGGWVVVRSLATLGTPGARIRPSLAGGLAEVQGTGTAPTFQTSAGASGWYLRELNVSADSIAATVYSVVNLTKNASNVVLDRVWVHPPVDRQNQRCVTANAAAVTIIDSWLDECHGKGFDSQAVITWDSPGPIRIERNTLGGAGENIMFGGADPTVAGLRTCDVTVRRNHIRTPIAWRGVWTKKNVVETKNVCRLLLEENVLEGSWGDGQTGFAVVFKSANQSGGCRWCGSSDITARRNLILNAAASWDLNGRGGDLGQIDSLTRRVLLEQNYSDVGGAAVGSDNRHFKISTGIVDLTLRRNTYTRTGTTLGNLYTGSDKGTTTATRLTIDHDLGVFGNYGVMGQWSPTTLPPGTVNLQVLGLAVWGPKARTGQLPNMTVVGSEAAGLAAGFGVSRATVEAATAGVVVNP